MNLNEFKVAQQAEAPQSVCIYGAPKAGKTTLAAELAKKYNLIWLDLEKGYQTLFSSVEESDADRITIIPVEDTGESPNAIKTVGKLFAENRTHRVCWRHGAISCVSCTKTNPQDFTQVNLYEHTTDTIVVVDSMSQLSDSAMAHVLGPVDIFAKKKIEYDHYDRQGLLLKNILNAMKRLNCHVVFISHEEELEQEDKTRKLCPVAGTRNFGRKVGRFFDHMIHMQIKNKDHRATSGTTSDMKIQTGSRNNVELERGDSILDLFKPKERTPDDKSAKPKAGNSAAAAMLAKLEAQKAAKLAKQSAEESANPASTDK